MVAAVAEPELTEQLLRLGVRPGSVLFVQAALRQVGPVAGGAAGVLAALRRALGPHGTLVAYAATPENSRSSREYQARTAGLNPAQLAAHHDRMPPFDPASTPASPRMGRLSEEIRRLPGALRSAHPQTSFAAVGPRAAEITAGHALNSHLGEDSPLAKLYALGADNLLLGVDLTRATAMHLADYRCRRFPEREYRCVVRGPDGARRWITFQGADLSDRHFAALLTAMGQPPGLRRGRVGAARALLVGVRDLVDAAERAPLPPEALSAPADRSPVVG